MQVAEFFILTGFCCFALVTAHKGDYRDCCIWISLALSKVGIALSASLFTIGDEIPFGSDHYFYRVFIEIFVFYAILVSQKTYFSLYMATTVAVTLIGYYLLDLDLINNTNVIYSQYEVVMYAIMVAQLCGGSKYFFEYLRSFYRHPDKSHDHHSISHNSHKGTP